MSCSAGSAAAGRGAVPGPCAAIAQAARKPARLALTPLPEAWITASQTSTDQGSTPAPASAPNITAETTVWCCSVTASLSNRMARCARVLARVSMRALSKRPSAMCIFSTVV